MTLSIRTLTAADLDAADAVLMAAYRMGSRKAELARYLDLQPDGWLLAAMDGVLVGLGGATIYSSFAYIGLMAVLPEAQGHGVGRAILAALLGSIADRGRPIVLLDASDAGYPLYERMGFVTDDRALIFWRSASVAREEAAASTMDTIDAIVSAPAHVASSSHASSTVPPSIREVRADDLPALVTFDTPRFGADRAAVLAAYLAECRGRAFVACDSLGRITGFLFAQPDKLGPWVAEAPEAAEALLLAALSLPFESRVSALVPAANADAQRLLLRHGFTQGRYPLRHMRLGGTPQLTRRAQLYGQASFAVG